MTTEVSPSEGEGRRRAALLSCLGAGFATLFDATTVSFTAPSLAASLGADTAAVQWFLASFSLTFGLGLVPAGRLGDAFGRRRLFVAGLLVFLVGGVVSATGADAATVVLGRFVQGLGAGFVSAQVLGVIQDLSHGAARIRAFVAYTATGALAGLIGPLAAGTILTLAPPDQAWRLILAAPLPFTIAAVALAWRGLPRTDVRRARVTLDLPAIALLGAVVVLGMLPVIDRALPDLLLAGIVGTCLLLVAVLIGWERRYARSGRLALFTPMLMRSRGFVMGNLVALLWFGALLAQGSAVTLYLLQSSSASPLLIAAVFLPGALGRLLVSLVSGGLFLSWGIAVLVVALAAEAVLTAVLAVSAPVLGPTAFLLTVAVVNGVLGVAGGIVEPPLRAVTLSHAGTSLHGVAASFLQLTQRLSATYFVALAIGILLGASGVATAAGLQVSLVVCAAAAALSTIVALDPSLRRAADALRGVSDATTTESAPDDTDEMSPARVSIEVVPWDDPRAESLRAAMDAEIGPRYADKLDGVEPAQVEVIGRALAVDPATIVATVIASVDGVPVGHAALRDLGGELSDALEVKRVFVERAARGTDVSRALMSELERIATAAGARRLILQTGDRQPEAVVLYERIGYSRIPIYPPYLPIAFSQCFEKPIAV